MTAAPDDSASPAGAGRIALRVPAWVWLVAVLAGLFHMAPYWRAASQTPEGWAFTGNIHVSPDYMQYRVWERQSQEEGVFVSNRFTPEPNPPHLPMLLYWSIGRTAAFTGLSPEWTYAWLGALLAAVLTVLVYALARHFLPTPRAAAWVFWVLLLGGGLGGILTAIDRFGLGDRFAILRRLAVDPLSGPGQAVPFEAYRGNYILQALLDTHFLVLWVVALSAVLALYATVTAFSARRLALTAFLFAAATFVHPYEGILLVAITAGVCALAPQKGLPWRQALGILGVTALAAGAVLLYLALRFKASGLPLPGWRGVIVAPVILLLAYPLAWALIAGGLGRFWAKAGLPGAFVLGWALGCLAITLSGPFYPYPDRGTLTLQIPLLLVAGAIYFGTRAKVGVTGLAAIVVLHASTPLLLVADLPRWTRFDPAAPHKWISQDHQAILEVLRASATTDDLLLADGTELRWLAPEYRGRHYAGHFFLTTDYERKQREVDEFFRSSDGAARAAFLERAHITLLYVPSRRHPDRFAEIPTLHPLRETHVGTLFRVAPSPPPIDPQGEGR